MEKLYLRIFSIFLLTFSANSFACKSPVFGQTLHENIFSYNTIVTVKITKSVHLNEYRYRPLSSFEAVVLTSFKGDLKVGDVFSGNPMTEEAKAVCPVHLDEGGEYLLALNSENGIYKISRFSWPIKSDFKYFPDYIAQLNEKFKNK